MMEHPELDSMQDYADKCYSEDTMNKYKIRDDLKSKAVTFGNEVLYVRLGDVLPIINSLVEQSEEEKCPICDEYKIEICGCNNHLLDY